MHAPPPNRNAAPGKKGGVDLQSKTYNSDVNLNRFPKTFKPIGMVARIVLARIMTRVARHAASNRPRSAVRQCTSLTYEARP